MDEFRCVDGLKIRMKFFDILILSLPNVASCLPSGKISQNILTRLLGEITAVLAKVICCVRQESITLADLFIYRVSIRPISLRATFRVLTTNIFKVLLHLAAGLAKGGDNLENGVALARTKVENVHSVPIIL